MIKIYSPKDEADLAIIQSILEGEGIQYYIHNDNFGSLNVGPRTSSFNEKVIMVDEKDEERAKELISDYLKTTKEEAPPEQKYSLKDKIRIACEFFLCGWIMPGKKWRRK